MAIVSSKEYPAKDVARIVSRVVPSYGKVSLAMLTMLQTEDILHPQGETIVRNRRRYTLSDAIAVTFLFDMRSHGMPMARLKKQVATIQGSRIFPPNLKILGGEGNLSWSYDIETLARKVSEVA